MKSAAHQVMRVLLVPEAFRHEPTELAGVDVAEVREADSLDDRDAGRETGAAAGLALGGPGWSGRAGPPSRAIGMPSLTSSKAGDRNGPVCSSRPAGGLTSRREGSETSDGVTFHRTGGS